MIELPREKYLSRIRPFYHDADLIKVITGVRRSGKSSVMRQIRDEVASSADVSIAYLDLDPKMYRKVRTADALESEIDLVLPQSGGGRYLFIDEVQNVEGFEEVVNAYRNDGVSVFITGSSSSLLSGELATKLTGRYLEFDIFPFSLSEVRDFKALNDLEFSPESDFQDYFVNGGFPKRFSFNGREEQEVYVKSVVGEIIEKDIKRRGKVRSVDTFERVLEHLMSTPAVTVSSTSVSDYLKSERVNVLPSTVRRYLEMMFDSRLVSKCLRTDIRGKKPLKTLYKSYVADPALHTYYPSARSDVSIGAMVENIVYNELVSRGYDVTVGKFGAKEIDFMVMKGRKTAYIQVTYLMGSPEAEAREVAPLLNLQDAHPKYIVSMDPITSDRSGIIHLNLVRDFLLGDGFSL